MTTLVVDTGINIVGIFCVEDGTFTAYHDDDISVAIERIKAAKEIVTYNGKDYDLRNLGKFAGLPGELPLTGTHTDMRSICWSDRIFGASLGNTYNDHFNSTPTFPPTYAGSCECDVYMTFKLWELWKQGNLKIIDGRHVQGSATPVRRGPSSSFYV